MQTNKNRRFKMQIEFWKSESGFVVLRINSTISNLPWSEVAKEFAGTWRLEAINLMMI